MAMRSRCPRSGASRCARCRRSLRWQLVYLCGRITLLFIPARRALRAYGGTHLAGRAAMTPLLTIMLFAAFGGVASAAFAVVFLWVREDHSALILPHFISFATGALLGAALLALLPEAIEHAGPEGAHGIGLTLVLGLGVFFVIEKLVLWWHAHAHVHGAGAAGCPQHADDALENHASQRQRPDSSHTHDHARDHASGALVLVGDSLHNALDGALIAAAFLASFHLGVL